MIHLALFAVASQTLVAATNNTLQGAAATAPAPAPLNTALWAAVIGATSALLVTLVKDYVLETLKERRFREQSEAEIYRQYLAPLCEACEKITWRSKEIFVDRRHAFLKTSTLPLEFNAYKRVSTLYRIAVLIGLIRGMTIELSALPRRSARFITPISKPVGAFQRALADGPHVEAHRLAQLCTLWRIDLSHLPGGEQAKLAMRFEVELYSAAGNQLKSDPNFLRNQPLDDRLGICRRLSNFLATEVRAPPPGEDLVRATVEPAIAGLSYREALLYRDWQDALGDAMIERDPDSVRRFRIIGYEKFTALLQSDAPWIKVLATSIDDIDFDEIDPTDFRSQQLRDVAVAVASILTTIGSSKDAALVDQGCLQAAAALTAANANGSS